MRYNLEFRKLTFYGLTRPESIRKSKQISGKTILSSAQDLELIHHLIFVQRGINARLCKPIPPAVDRNRKAACYACEAKVSLTYFFKPC